MDRGRSLSASKGRLAAISPNFRLTKDDVAVTVDYIRQSFPDFSFEAKDVLNVDPTFVVQYFKTFFTDLKEQLAHLAHITINEDEGILKMNEVIVLYCEVSQLFLKLSCSNLHLIDMYVKNNKMYQFIKFSLHFHTFLNNYMDNLQEMFDEHQQKLTEMEECLDLKRKSEEERAANAEQLGRITAGYETDGLELEENNKQTQKVMKEKAAHVKISAENKQKIASLRSEGTEFEHESKLLDEQLAELRDQLVEDADYAKMEETAKTLDDETERVKHQVVDDDDNQLEMKRNTECFEEGKTSLESVLSVGLQVEELKNLQEEESLHQMLEKLENAEVLELQDCNRQKSSQVEELQEYVEKMEKAFKNTERTFLEKIQADEIEMKKALMENCAYFEESKKLETEIVLLKKNIERFEGEEKVLDAVVAKEYQKILNMSRDLTESCYDMLLRAKKWRQGYS